MKKFICLLGLMAGQVCSAEEKASVVVKHPKRITSICVPTGNEHLIAMSSEQISVTNLETGKELYTLTADTDDHGQQFSFTAIAASSKSDIVAVASLQWRNVEKVGSLTFGRLKLHKLSTGKHIEDIPLGPRYNVITSISISENGQLVAIGTKVALLQDNADRLNKKERQSHCTLYSVPNKKLISTLETGNLSVTALRFVDNDNSIFYTASVAAPESGDLLGGRMGLIDVKKNQIVKQRETTSALLVMATDTKTNRWVVGGISCRDDKYEFSIFSNTKWDFDNLKSRYTGRAYLLSIALSSDPDLLYIGELTERNHKLICIRLSTEKLIRDYSSKLDELPFRLIEVPKKGLYVTQNKQLICIEK